MAFARKLLFYSALTLLFATCSNINRQTHQDNFLPPKGNVILIANQHSSSVTMIEVMTGRIVTHIPVGNGPHELTSSTDGRTVAVPLFGHSLLWGDGHGKELAIIDVASASVRQIIDLGENTSPHGAVFLNDNRSVAITSSDANTVVVANTQTGETLQTIQLENPPYLLALTPDLQFAYTSNPQTNTVSEINLSTRSLSRTFNIKGSPGGIAVTSDGKNLWVAQTEADTLSVVNLENGETIRTFEKIDGLRRIKISPDGRIALLTSQFLNEVMLFDVFEKKELGKIKLDEGIFASGITFGTDSKTAFVTCPSSNLVLELDLEKRTTLRKFKTQSSPDGIILIKRN